MSSGLLFAIWQTPTKIFHRDPLSFGNSAACLYVQMTLSAWKNCVSFAGDWDYLEDSTPVP